METYEFDNGRQLRSFLRKKFGNKALKEVGLKIEAWPSLGIFHFEYDIPVATTMGNGNVEVYLPKDIEISKEAKELIIFTKSNKFI